MKFHDVVVLIDEKDIQTRVESIAAGPSTPLRKARELLAISRALGRRLMSFRSRGLSSAPEAEPSMRQLGPEELACLKLIGSVRAAAGRALAAQEPLELAASGRTA